jgi:N-acetylated-alpha-linked acidic dipeptidase
MTLENPMRSVLIVCLALFSGIPSSNAETPPLGFDDSSGARQRALEEAFDRELSASDLDAWMKHLSARPHQAGSPADEANAEYLAGLLESWGYDVDLADYQVLFPTPKERVLELVAPTTFTASLTEDTLPEDPGTAVREELLPPYNAFSADGDVEGELVYVNYGTPEDYETLERYGIDVTGKIVIARYGKSWRGIKPKMAAEHGAIGAIIYSDPADDGYARGDVYPEGPYKQESAVQRGSVMDLPLYSGDVLTPGVAATQRARRLAVEDSPAIVEIPVLPISYRDALPLLRAIGGAVVPETWRGALALTYHFGPGPARVHLRVQSNWNRITIRDVVARLPGQELPAQWVLRGNHYDAWNEGASDPLSGLVALLAEAKAVGALAKAGSPPARTIVYTVWDAEEPGLIGSTEWVEEHADELKRHAVAYINTDGSSRGFVSISGSHTLERFFNQIGEDVEDPETGASLIARYRAHVEVDGDDAAKARLRDDGSIRLGSLGSGSDYTPFLQHLGIPSAHLAFGGEGEGGSYHTLYDTYRHFTTWRDPGFVYGVALAKLAGRATLRLANAAVLPFDFDGFADNVGGFVAELEKLAADQRAAVERTNRMIDSGAYELALDPTKPLGPPKRREPAPFFNFAPLKNSVERLKSAAAEYSELRANGEVPDGARARLDELLYTSEQLLTREAGLEGRPWYKHFIYAPGFHTGYGVKTIPGVREAIEGRNYDEVDGQIRLAAEVIDGMTQRIRAVNALLKEGGD